MGASLRVWCSIFVQLWGEASRARVKTLGPKVPHCMAPNIAKSFLSKGNKTCLGLFGLMTVSDVISVQ